MLRKDTIYMVESHWEPKVPEQKIVDEQIRRMRDKLTGSVRLYLGRVTSVVSKSDKNASDEA